jgi:hypothetical protein
MKEAFRDINAVKHINIGVARIGETDVIAKTIVNEIRLRRWLCNN